MQALRHLEEFGERFWYWRGGSGKRYIHSVYTLEDCPPLPGAIYVLVERDASGTRRALKAGRFGNDWSQMYTQLRAWPTGEGKVDEVHVHLLANTDDRARRILRDIEAGFEQRQVVEHLGFQEDGNLFLQDSVVVPVQVVDRALARV